MSTKLSNAQVNPEFDNLFSFATEEEKIQHQSEMISLRILSEVEKICEERKIKKKDLADKVGTSRSYITQLFRGNKQVNTYIMAKFENALDICFDIRAQQPDSMEPMIHDREFLTWYIKPSAVNRYPLEFIPGGQFLDKTCDFFNTEIQKTIKQRQIAG